MQQGQGSHTCQELQRRMHKALRHWSCAFSICLPSWNMLQLKLASEDNSQAAMAPHQVLKKQHKRKCHARSSQLRCMMDVKQHPVSALCCQGLSTPPPMAAGNCLYHRAVHCSPAHASMSMTAKPLTSAKLLKADLSHW